MALTPMAATRMVAMNEVFMSGTVLDKMSLALDFGVMFNEPGSSSVTVVLR